VRNLPPASANPRGSYTPNDRTEQLREEDRREREALAMLAGTDLAHEAVQDRWAPALIDFVKQNQRMPNGFEADKLVALSRRNDADVRSVDGGSGHMLRKFREAMHQTAARRLGVVKFEMTL
jgi:hypothetical protein